MSTESDSADIAVQQSPWETLDLRSNGRLDDSIRKQYNDLANSLRAEFVQFIGTAYINKHNSLDWWLEAPASRNPVFSDLFHELISLTLVEALIVDNKTPARIHVDTLEHKLAIQSIASDHKLAIQVVLPPITARAKRRVRTTLSPFRSIVRLLLEWSVVRTSALWDKNAAKPADSYVLIDTFAIPGFTDTDRYYPGLMQHADKLRESVRFVPQFFDHTLVGLFRAAYALRKSDKPLLIKEDFIKLSDLIWCFGHLGRIRKFDFDNARFRNIEVGKLIEADLKKRRAFRCALRGLINYRFAQALKRRQVPVAKAIDWFENHPMDRGWNAGFNTHFPQSARAGYTGFYPAGQSFRPSSHEARGNVLPPVHLLMGDGFYRDFTEFYPSCQVDTAPAFRYQELLEPNEQPSQNTSPDTVLVAMPYYLDLCSGLLQAISGLLSDYPSWKIIVKPHPARAITDIAGHAEFEIGRAELVDSPLSEALKRCAVMLTGAQASTIIEAAAVGVPTVIFADPASTIEASVPSAVPDALVSTANTLREIGPAIEELLNARPEIREARHHQAREFRDRCFSPVNNQTVHRMLAA